jgi:hypothetical protein
MRLLFTPHLERLEHLPPVLLGLLGILLQASHQHLCGTSVRPDVRHHEDNQLAASCTHLQDARQLLLLVRHAGQLGTLGGAGEPRLVGCHLLGEDRRAAARVPHHAGLLVRLDAAPLGATGHMLQLRRQRVHARGGARKRDCHWLHRTSRHFDDLPPGTGCTHTSCCLASRGLNSVRCHVT